MFRSLKEVDVEGKTVLVRVDYNVPLDTKGRITDDTRIRQSLPTIEYLLERNCRVIVMTHLGRPKGHERHYRTDVLAQRLSELLRRSVQKVSSCTGPVVVSTVKRLPEGGVLMLENLRFYPEEEQNRVAFARKLASLADLYVNEAFSNSHRAHASMVGVPSLLHSCAGFTFEHETIVLSRLINKPKRPFVAILGGVKIKDKIATVETVAKTADAVLIGGAMMFTFLRAQGNMVGKSTVENDRVLFAKKQLQLRRKKIVLPVDTMIDLKKKSRSVNVRFIPPEAHGLDIGPKTVKLFRKHLSRAQTVFWNGPLGFCEDKRFAKGTAAIARILSKSRAFTVAGGGDTVDVINHLKLGQSFDFLSTGGGAALDLLAGKNLPALVALEKSARKRF